MNAGKIQAYGIDGMNFEIIPFGSYNNSFLSLKNFDEVEYAKLDPTRKGFMLSVCLPRAVRNDNILPYGLRDIDTINEIGEEITDALDDIFFDGYESKLTYAEICGTCGTVGKGKCDNIFRLFTNALLHNDEQNKLFVIRNKKMELVPYCSGMQSRTIKNRWKLKAYDKYREMGILSERELVRGEFCIVKRQIEKTLAENTEISSVLTQSAVESLIGLYRPLFDELMNEFVEPYLSTAKEVFRQAYIENKCRPTIPYLKCREIIVDEQIVKEVIEERYKGRGRSNKYVYQDIRRLKKYDLPYDTISTIEKLHHLDEI